MMEEEITTKGFDCYKFVKDGKEWFELYDVMSKKELIRSIKKCIKKPQKPTLNTKRPNSCH